MSVQQNRPSRVSHIFQRTFQPLFKMRKSSASGEMLPNERRSAFRQDSSGASDAHEDSTPPTSFSVTDDDEVCDDKVSSALLLGQHRREARF